jgi:hypothetical protein
MMDYFPEEPFGCHGIEPGGIIHNCGLNAFDPKMRDILNLGREKYGKPIIVSSGCRCKAHNAAIGGARRSGHLPGPDAKCHATDLYEESAIERAILHRIFYELGIRRFEVSDKHLHVDNADFYLPTPVLSGVNFTGAIET